MPLHRRGPLAFTLLLAPLLYISWPSISGSPSPHHHNNRFFPHFTSNADGDISNSTLGFGDILVINLPSRTDRRDAMTLAGAVSNLTLSWIEGLEGSEHRETEPGEEEGEEGETRPPPGDGVDDETAESSRRRKQRKVSERFRVPGARGSWRAHMNALQAVVERDLGSALILEDDVDWDVRLKLQLRHFAAASRMWLEEQAKVVTAAASAAAVSSGSDKGHNRPRSPPREGNPGPGPLGSTANKAEEAQRLTIRLSERPIPGAQASQSAYGADWDVLWLGHCGADLPPPQRSPAEETVPSLRVSLPRDPTVPVAAHLKAHRFARPDALGAAYEPHTRVVHAVSGNACTLAYAVSARGARKMMWRLGVEDENGELEKYQWDLMVRDWCQGEFEPGGGGGGVGGHEVDGLRHGIYKRRGGSERGGASARGEKGSDEEEEDGAGAAAPVCLTVQPPLFSHYYTKGSSSDIMAQGGGYAKGEEMTGSPYIRVSVRKNLGRLSAGRPFAELEDQLPDDGKGIW
ncbi:glycosyltransferase family 25 protein [Xylariomycetidae sp. FL2044]|nr:glycosyltransferase family 25 protein [Xylariomycetidae sp. FL2044]